MEPHRIRPACPADLETVLRHRRRMFEDMGSADQAALDAMITVARPLLGDGLSDGTYRGWLALAADGTVAAGGGIIRTRWSPGAAPRA